MNRAEKAETVEKLAAQFRETPNLILTAFRGLTVNQATDLRRRIKSAGGSYLVIKNRLAKRAAEGTPVEKLIGHLEGPRAIATHESDPVVLAKVLAEFAKDNPALELVGGLVDATAVLSADEIKALSKLPGTNELRAQLLALIQTPATTLARLIQTPGSQLARVLDARREQQESAP